MLKKILCVALFVLVAVVTPFEASWLNQELAYMYILNISEVSLFSFGMFVGSAKPKDINISAA